MKMTQTVLAGSINRFADGLPMLERRLKAELRQMSNVLQTLGARARSEPGVLHESDFVFHVAPTPQAPMRQRSGPLIKALMPGAVTR